MTVQLTVSKRSHLALSITVAGLLTLSACGGNGNGSGALSGGTAGSALSDSALSDSALVSNKLGVVNTPTTIDANLSNPWGLASGPGLPFWIADNNSNVATLYSSGGQILTNTVTGSTDVGVSVPQSQAGVAANTTGAVYNGHDGFLVPTSNGPESAQFIFDGEGGTIAAWAADSGSQAVTMYDDGIANGADHAVYKGLALGTANGTTLLYATDLHNSKVDVFDTTFAKPAQLQGKFADPTLPSGYAPFGIAALNDQLYVTFAMQDVPKHDEQAGVGLGFVDVFDFSGNFVSRFASAGALDAPWGLALAPPGFGTFGGDVLVGNFGDGMINVFAPNGTSLANAMGPLTVGNGGAINIPGLWALEFGNGDADKPVTSLFYTAGFADQTHGAFGSISVPPPSAPAAPSPY